MDEHTGEQTGAPSGDRPDGERRRKGRPRDTSADTRILTAAAELILERGYDRMTVDAVAERARAGKATVYRRWRGKDDLAFAALREMYSTELPVPDTGDFRADLHTMVRRGLEFAASEEGRAYLRMTTAEAVRDERNRRLYAAAYEGQAENVRAVLRRAIDRGEVRADIPLDYAVDWMAGILVLNSILDRPAPAAADTEAIAEAILHGIAAPEG